ncbi:MAG TPA: thioredoxin [Chthoniobacterales bacterium]|nr:thioredoxin [Chthoniobacterales bacterium]
MSEPININEESFDRAVIQSPVPVLVDFWAPWCGPCKMISPLLDEIARENPETLRVTKVNVDDHPSLAARYGVRSIPSLLVFDKGQLKDTTVGLVSKATLLSKVSALAA